MVVAAQVFARAGFHLFCLLFNNYVKVKHWVSYFRDKGKNSWLSERMKINIYNMEYFLAHSRMRNRYRPFFDILLIEYLDGKIANICLHLSSCLLYYT